MNELNLRIKQLIIDALELEDISPSDIDDDAPLFGEGLGLDSIDALELGMALKKQFGITLDAKSDATKAHFASVNALTRLVSQQAEQAPSVNQQQDTHNSQESYRA